MDIPIFSKQTIEYMISVADIKCTTNIEMSNHFSFDHCKEMLINLRYNIQCNGQFYIKYFFIKLSEEEFCSSTLENKNKKD